MPAKKPVSPELRALCNKVIAHIKKYPLVEQMTVVSEKDCGTTACVAGHTVLAIKYPRLPTTKWVSSWSDASFGWISEAVELFVKVGYKDPETLKGYFGVSPAFWPKEAKALYDNGERSRGAIKLLEMIKAGKA